MTRRTDSATDTPAEAVDGPELPSPEDTSADAVVESVADNMAGAVLDDPAPAALKARARRSGVLGPLLGGAMAALGGFGLSHFNVLGLAAPDRSAEIAALDQKLDAAIASLDSGRASLESGLRQAVDRLADRVAALEAAPAPDLSGLDDLDRRLLVIETLPTGGDASAAALASKLADLERKVADLPASGADTGEVDAALARLAAVEAEAQARAAEAAALAEAAAQARALEVLTAAVNAGRGFAAELEAVADAQLQAALTPYADGVAPLAQLQADFPESARAALLIARANASDSGWTTRLVDFLAAQTGARSLTPRDGADPDAILSRAEFALAEGRLADAVLELGALGPDVQAPFEEWIASAKARLAVEAVLAGAL
ncbi:hypothetical protein [Tabrizicola sp.]|uniref:COG4223 family protein n=1 Tax=Tabrizicola sp. TaxID=2005166 RepID=UPI00261A2FF3|nr:hypothetical protein [Tabrizicola sp.]MDM7931779.1 hypothetical protein [Tabrizicola sp.]